MSTGGATSTPIHRRRPPNSFRAAHEPRHSVSQPIKDAFRGSGPINRKTRSRTCAPRCTQGAITTYQTHRHRRQWPELRPRHGQRGRGPNRSTAVAHPRSLGDETSAWRSTARSSPWIDMAKSWRWALRETALLGRGPTDCRPSLEGRNDFGTLNAPRMKRGRATKPASPHRAGEVRPRVYSLWPSSLVLRLTPLTERTFSQKAIKAIHGRSSSHRGLRVRRRSARRSRHRPSS